MDCKDRIKIISCAILLGKPMLSSPALKLHLIAISKSLFAFVIHCLFSVGCLFLSVLEYNRNDEEVNLARCSNISSLPAKVRIIAIGSRGHILTKFSSILEYNRNDEEVNL
jgi:hypothetical protein